LRDPHVGPDAVPTELPLFSEIVNRKNADFQPFSDLFPCEDFLHSSLLSSFVALLCCYMPISI
jgi:hypothetical protein